MTSNIGSEWKKWDLHVHTASSYDYKYNGADADKKLCQVLLDNEICAVAITDHFLIDGKRIANLRVLAPTITFFPGVELRTDKGGNNLHIILIFPDNMAKRNQTIRPKVISLVCLFRYCQDSIIRLHCKMRNNFSGL